MTQTTGTRMPPDVQRELFRLLALGERGALLAHDARQLRMLAEAWGLKLAWRRLELNGPHAGQWREAT